MSAYVISPRAMLFKAVANGTSSLCLMICVVNLCTENKPKILVSKRAETLFGLEVADEYRGAAERRGSTCKKSPKTSRDFPPKSLVCTTEHITQSLVNFFQHHLTYHANFIYDHDVDITQHNRHALSNASQESWKAPAIIAAKLLRWDSKYLVNGLPIDVKSGLTSDSAAEDYRWGWSCLYFFQHQIVSRVSRTAPWSGEFSQYRFHQWQNGKMDCRCNTDWQNQLRTWGWQPRNCCLLYQRMWRSGTTFVWWKQAKRR